MRFLCIAIILMSVSLAMAQPSAITDPASSVGQTDATLNGRVNPNGQATSVRYQYGTTIGYGQLTQLTNIGSGNSYIDLPEPITGLLPSTLYHFRIVGTNSGGSGFGQDRTFTTGGGNPPTVVTKPAFSIGNTTTTLDGSINPNGLASTYKYEYGLSTVYGTVVGPVNVGSGNSPIDVPEPISGLTPGTLYHFRIVGNNSVGPSNGIDRTFTTGGNPSSSITDPATNIGTTSATLNGRVNPNGQTTTVRFQYGTTTNYESLTLARDIGSGNSYVPVAEPITGLLPATLYHFRIVGTNNSGSGFGSDRTFTTTVTPPPIPTLASPPNSSTGVPISPTLTWNQATGATSYDVQVATDAGFSNVIRSQNLTSTSWQVSPALSNGTVYYWRVRANNAGGSSNYSSGWNFTTTVSPPSIPTLVSPTNGSVCVSIPVILSWTPVGGATSYDVQVATDAGFSNVIRSQNLTGTSWQVSPALSNGTVYYWRVRANNAGGSSNYSSGWNLTTAIQASSLQAPADGQTGVATNVTLQWSSVTGAALYNVQVATDQLFGNIVRNQTTSATSWQISPSLQNNSRFYWRVNSGCTWSLVRTFTTSITSVEQTNSLIPDQFQLMQNYPNPFNPSTKIEFSIIAPDNVTLKIFNALGVEVATLVNEHLNAGTFKTEWDAKNMPSGTYFYRLQAGEFVATKKLLLLK